MILLSIGGCTSSTDLLDVSGMEGGALAADGLWVREHLIDGSGAELSTLHTQFLHTDPWDCSELQRLWDGPTSEPEVPPVTDRASCEVQRSAWLAYADPWRPPGLFVALGLWDTSGAGPGAPPADGTFTPVDGADDDLLEYTFQARNVLGSWYTSAAWALDCDAAASGGDPFARVPSWEDIVREEYSATGPVTFELQGDTLRAVLDLTVTGSGHDGGTISGEARLEACDVERVLDAG